MPKSIDVKLPGIDYTVFKVIEYYLFSNYFAVDQQPLAFSALPQPGRMLQYCGFKKPHPHIDESLLRVSFSSEDSDKDTLLFMLLKAAEQSKDIFAKISEQFQ